jgi:redox-sensing transcriptional repressor
MSEQNDKQTLVSEGAKVSNATIKRLPRYFRYLRELRQNNIFRISSLELSKMMNVTASQIRQDLNCFGGFGQQGYGYNVDYLYRNVSEILGVTRSYNAVIIGAGNLGRALSQSPIFEKRGVNLTAIFDSSTSVIGTKVGDFTILDVKTMEDFCVRNHVDVAVLTVPRDCAKVTAERLKNAGIRGIWNFTNVELELDSDMMAESVHMGDSLMLLTYRISQREKQGD